MFFVNPRVVEARGGGPTSDFFRGGSSSSRGGYYGGYRSGSYRPYYGGYYGRGYGYANGYYNFVPQVVPSYGDSLPAPTSAPAHLSVNVPASAQIWVNGQKVDSTGTRRCLTTPALSSTSRYSYDIKVTWMDNGMPVTETRQVIVTAGSDATVAFPSTVVSSR
jgi:uncharacterized protein (TIGR03000 family)